MFTPDPATSRPVPAHLSTNPDDLRLSLSSKEGWHRFVATTPTRPKRLASAAYAQLDDTHRALYDQARIRWHRSLHILRHTQLVRAWNSMTDVIVGQDADDGPGLGLALTGGPGHGKTAATVGYLRNYERDLRATYPAAFEQENEFIPVVYSSLLPRAGLKAQMEHLLDFFAHPVAKSTTGQRLLRQVVELLNACRTKILVLDQAQNLRRGDKRDDEVAANLKEVMDATSTTMILCGIDLDQRGPLAPNKAGRFTDDREQLARRFTLVGIDKVAYDNPEWADLLAAAESRLILHQAKPGDLSRSLARPIWEMSEGRIGVALNLINVAANAAINNRSERITAASLRRSAPTIAAARRSA